MYVCARVCTCACECVTFYMHESNSLVFVDWYVGLNLLAFFLFFGGDRRVCEWICSLSVHVCVCVMCTIPCNRASMSVDACLRTTAHNCMWLQVRRVWETEKKRKERRKWRTRKKARSKSGRKKRLQNIRSVRLTVRPVEFCDVTVM